MSYRELEPVVQASDDYYCPNCSGKLEPKNGRLKCSTCGQAFESEGDIPLLFWPNEWDSSKKDVTFDIKHFYEKTPFPNYDEFDDVASLISKSKTSLFAKLLDEQIPFGIKVLECGCGTGQMTNFLAIANRTVIGADMCLNSLQLAQEFKSNNGLKRAKFVQMNLFRPCFKPNSFDLVISNGVLHHTSDPYLAFESISRLVKPGGYLLVGLYHKYGRLVTDLRRVLFNLTGDKWTSLDRHAVDAGISDAKKSAWFADQYKNPHESKHTIREVLKWIEACNFSFVHSIPNTIPFKSMDEREQLFEKQRIGRWYERLLVNLGMFIRGHREGGFFIVIAKKVPNERPK